MRLAGQAKGGYYPTPRRVVDLLAQLIDRPSTYGRLKQTLRLLDPCCGGGDALAQLADGLHHTDTLSVETYGVELHRDRAEAAADQLNHALASDLFATSIANEAFGLLLLNPPYDHDAADIRTEHAFLTHTTRYLAENGLLVFIVPKQRLATSARFLSANYWKINCWAFPEPEREAFDQVILIGQRRREPVPSQYMTEIIQAWSEGEPDPLECPPFPIYDLPAMEPGDVLFTIRNIDPVTAAVEARKSGLWNNPLIKDALWPTNNRTVNPLMPLRRGHLAMLVAAGFLDNLALEADGQRVLVKGRTSKEMILVEATEETEIYREKLQTTVVVLDLDNGNITDITT